MALVLLDRAKVVATSMSGTGDNYTLTNAPPTGFVDFTGVGDGNTTYYAAVAGDLFEIGIGTFTLSNEVLTRTDGNVIVSSNVGNNNRVSWPSNSTPTVFITQPADKAVSLDGSGNLTLTGDVNIDKLLTVDQDTSSQMVTSFEGLNGRVHIGRYGHILQQNTDDSTTEFWSTSTRFDGSFDVAFGTSTNEGVVASSNAIMSMTQTGATTFFGDVTFTGASYNAVWDKSDNALEFGDNAEIRFGAVDDLRIFHASDSSIIRDQQSNPIFIQTDNTVHLTKNLNSETMAKFIGDGAVELYHNNIKKIETTSTGILLESTDDGTAAAPIIELYRHSASPANNDDLGAIEFHGEDDNDDKLKYAQIRGGIFQPTDTNERGYLYFDVMQNGTMTNFLQLGGNTANFSKPAKFNSGFHLQNNDTTFARVSAGVASIEGNTIITTANSSANPFSSDVIVKTATGGSLQLQTSDTTVSANDVLGKIEFSAPDEATSGTTVTVGAIELVAESDFDTQNKAYTDLVFKLSDSSSINVESMRLHHNKDLELKGQNLLTSNGAGFTIDNDAGPMSLKGSQVSVTSDAALFITSDGSFSTGDITIDTDGDIILDSHNADFENGGIFFKDNGLIFAHFVSNDFYNASYLTTDFEIRNQHTNAFSSPIFKLWRDSASPAADDDIGEIRFDGEDSGGTRTTYASVVGEIINPTHGNEEGQIHFTLANGDNSVTNGYTTIYKFGVSRLLLEGTTQLQFGDSGTYIHQSADGVLDLVADTELELNGGIVDVNATTGNITLDAQANDTFVEILGNNGGGTLQLNCENNSHGVKIQSPDHSAGQSYTLKLPDNQVAADKILKVKSISGSGATAIGQLEFADESGGGGVTVQDEGSALSTTATTLDFVGAGVTASGTGATKTITISGGSSGITVQDEGSSLSTAGTTLDFVGAGVVASGTGATKTITIAGGGSGITVQDEGSALSTVGTTLNFVGAGVTASGTGSTKTITISGGGGGGGITTGKAIAMAMVFG